MEPSSRPLYLVCTRKEVCNLLNRILCRKHVVAQKGTDGNVAWSTLTRELNGWHKTGMLQQYHLNTFHVTTWLCYHPIKTSHQVSKHTGSCLACNITLTDALINVPWTNYSRKHAKHLSYQRFKRACLVRSSRSLARRSSRLRHLFRNLRYSEEAY